MKECKGKLVTENGRVFNKSGKELKVSSWGTISIYYDGQLKSYFVGRLVAEAYLPNPNGYRYVHHKDGNKLNNHVSNLEWCNYGSGKREVKHVEYVDKFDNVIVSYSSMKSACMSRNITNIMLKKMINEHILDDNGCYWRYEGDTIVRSVFTIVFTNPLGEDYYDVLNWFTTYIHVCNIVLKPVSSDGTVVSFWTTNKQYPLYKDLKQMKLDLSRKMDNEVKKIIVIDSSGEYAEL